MRANGWFHRSPTVVRRREAPHRSPSYITTENSIAEDVRTVQSTSDPSQAEYLRDPSTILRRERSHTDAEARNSNMAMSEGTAREREYYEDERERRHRRRHRRHRYDDEDSSSPRVVRVYRSGGSVHGGDGRLRRESGPFDRSGSSRSSPSRERDTDSPRHHRRRHRSSQLGSDRKYIEVSEPMTVLGIRNEAPRYQRSSSVRRAPPPAARPTLQRSSTTSSRRLSWFPPLAVPAAAMTRGPPPTRDPTAHRSRARRSSDVGTAPPVTREPGPPSTVDRRNSAGGLLGSFFPKPPPRGPVKTVECLTCMTDVPVTKSAKLGCGHIMCHDCLKRIFSLSVTDPQHMPPKCCTSDHIPLKHVDRLFSDRFKMNWNRKYQEYTTKNRLYCPTRGCGEWIKPSQIHSEGGRKYGKCQRCRTKVCVLCNGKWHMRRDCPKDEETNRLVEKAKQEGWQRCYSCRAMIELKEGCNHMTCRCRAEFCMICGSKWKTCNCPWFNHESVVADRLNHMNEPFDIPPPPAPLNVRGVHPPLPADRREQTDRNARTYADELAHRRRQEREDEQFARRLQQMGFDEDIRGFNAEYGMAQGAARMAAAHAMSNRGLRNLESGAHYSRDSPQRSPLRPPFTSSWGDRWDDDASWSFSERVVPRRPADGATDHTREAAVHRPGLFSATAPPPPPPPPPPLRRLPKTSELAGVTRSRTEGRVDAWLDYVEDGVAA